MSNGGGGGPAGAFKGAELGALGELGEVSAAQPLGAGCQMVDEGFDREAGGDGGVSQMDAEDGGPIRFVGEIEGDVEPK